MIERLRQKNKEDFYMSIVVCKDNVNILYTFRD